MLREDLIKLAREALAKADPAEHCADPARYEPPVARADAARLRARCYRRCAHQPALYPEGG